MFSWKTIKDLVDRSGQTFQELAEIYNEIPDTQCLRRGYCCSLMPETTFVEALSAFRSLIQFEPDMRNQIFKRIVSYFFLNALEIPSCPFLEDNSCLIYSERFLGCRAYGLWSPNYYEKLSLSSRKAKKDLQASWHRLGVSLPKAVIDFHQPYCLHVTPQKDLAIDDATLEGLRDRTAILSGRYSSLNQLFVQTYYADMSFLSASLVFGAAYATKAKFSIVRDTLNKKDKETLNQIMQKIPDINTFIK